MGGFGIDRYIKQTIVRGNQVPYMNEQWRKAIRHRNKLWWKFTTDRMDTYHRQDKIQCNKCTSLQRKAIKEHFLKKSTSSENPCEFWNAYRLFLHGKTTQGNDSILDSVTCGMNVLSNCIKNKFAHDLAQFTVLVAISVDENEIALGFKQRSNVPDVAIEHLHVCISQNQRIKSILSSSLKSFLIDESILIGLLSCDKVLCYFVFGE